MCSSAVVGCRRGGENIIVINPQSARATINQMHYPWFVVTGAPSSGKTTVVNLLKEQGYHTQEEVARKLLIGKEYVESSELEQYIIRQKITDHMEAPRDRVVFFDRGIPDSLAYYRFHNYQYDAILRHSLQYARYEAVFLLEPLSFEKDGLRNDYAEYVQELHQHIKEAYHDLGLFVISVPVTSAAERFRIIQKEVDTHEAIVTGRVRMSLV